MEITYQGPRKALLTVEGPREAVRQQHGALSLLKFSKPPSNQKEQAKKSGGSQGPVQELVTRIKKNRAKANKKVDRKQKLYSQRNSSSPSEPIRKKWDEIKWLVKFDRYEEHVRNFIAYRGPTGAEAVIRARIVLGHI